MSFFQFLQNTLPELKEDPKILENGSTDYWCLVADDETKVNKNVFGKHFDSCGRRIFYCKTFIICQRYNDSEGFLVYYDLNQETFDNEQLKDTNVPYLKALIEVMKKEEEEKKDSSKGVSTNSSEVGWISKMAENLKNQVPNGNTFLLFVQPKDGKDVGHVLNKWLFQDFAKDENGKEIQYSWLKMGKRTRHYITRCSFTLKHMKKVVDKFFQNAMFAGELDYIVSQTE